MAEFDGGVTCKFVKNVTLCVYFACTNAMPN